MGVIAWALDRLLGPKVLMPKGVACRICAHFEDGRDDTVDPLVGYCANPFHATAASEHYEYGGHWTHEDSWCPLFTPTPEDRADSAGGVTE